MKTKLIIATLCSSLMFNLVASEITPLLSSDSPYRNLREGNSHLITSHKEDDVVRLYKDTPALESLRKIINDKTINRCATKVVSAIQKELSLSSEDETELAILGLRLDDSIDDIAAGILIKAADSNFLSHPIAKNDLTAEEETKALDIYKTKIADLQNKTLCSEDTYRALVGKLNEGSYKFIKNLKHLNKLALDKKIIKENDFKTLERMRAKKVHEWPITLSSYRSTLDTVAKNFPTRKKESAKLVTEAGRFKNKTSLRQGLYEKFNATQIILLANVVKSLKKRLEAKDIMIHINYVDQESEIISLSPMEKFRFILKLLRKELALINNSTIINGRQATFLDIITAAYEVGYISADEIDQFAALEEIWNPKKTTKEKVMVWVKLFGGVASVLLPPPFGFLSVMAIMLIDQQVSEAPVNPDSDFNLM
ncbi:hypothetical protein C8D79_0717 [Bacteriovorax stolpii]|nr:hypothetical protein [Bacteriovorax stolpii]TDP55662.1 hypothetical protein C8D79_0717 [Bacteriovorax stolpii]